MSFDYAIHSDFLIHWTGGNDIDCQYDPDWHRNKEGKSLTDKYCTDAYIDRLHNILKYGLWMTKGGEDCLTIGKTNISIPKTPMTCFTELKLSESRKHAKRYGRLGIGVKRPFILNRSGRPLVYYHEKRINDKFLKVCINELKDTNLLNFFKPMNSSDRLIYDFYSESEWRIIFFKDLLESGLIIDPTNSDNIEANNYYLSLKAIEQRKLEFIMPLDCWFSMIIYPSLKVKNMAYQSADIRKLIKKIKKRNNPNSRCPNDESQNWPIEIDLDACRNF